MKKSVQLDRTEQKRAERHEAIMFRTFQENIRYLIKMYKTLKLPSIMFSQTQSEWLFDVYEIIPDGRYFVIKEKCLTDVKIHS